MARPDHAPRHLDLVPNPARRGGSEPLLCVLQSDLADRATRIVAPVSASGYAGPLAPSLRHEGREYHVLLRGLTNAPLRVLGPAVGSAEAARDDITRGLDLLFLGV